MRGTVNSLSQRIKQKKKNLEIGSRSCLLNILLCICWFYICLSNATTCLLIIASFAYKENINMLTTNIRNFDTKETVKFVLCREVFILFGVFSRKTLLVNPFTNITLDF